MEAWIPITIAAAAFQTLRFMAQKQLASGTLSATGATLARFLYAAPVVAVLIAMYAAVQGYAFPQLSLAFWLYAGIGGLGQILATVCVVALFAHRNFAVWITFKKTEVMLTALAGFLVLGDRVTPFGALAIGIGFLGVLWLSDRPDGGGGRLRFFNKAAGLGVLSGVFFAVSAVGYRGAVLQIAGTDTVFQAGLTLAIVTAGQSIAMSTWLAWRDPGQVTAVLRSWKTSGFVGLLSMAGSFCWFAAFSLQNAAYVFAVGQIELIFSILAATLWFKEKITAREGWGMAILTLSITVLVVAG